MEGRQENISAFCQGVGLPGTTAQARSTIAAVRANFYEHRVHHLSRQRKEHAGSVEQLCAPRSLSLPEFKLCSPLLCHPNSVSGLMPTSRMLYPA